MPDTKARAAAPGFTQTREDLSAGEQTIHDTQTANHDFDAVKADIERRWRDAELADTDMYGLSDRTMSAAMSTYRQELRDMPDLTGFPNTHVRPGRPEGE